MRKLLPHLSIAIGLLASCSTGSHPGTSAKHSTWQRIPDWAQQRVGNPWWQVFGDAKLNQQIAYALANSPDMAAIVARLDRSEAQLKQTDASRLPQLNLGIGWRDGRRQAIDFGPYELRPWQGSAQLSWEIDLTGKLLAATRSARYARDAAFWDVHAARLQLASRIASTYFLINQLNGDISIMKENLTTSSQLVTIVREQVNGGIIAATRLNEQQAMHTQNQRALLELQRLRDISVIQLQTLSGNRSKTLTFKSQRLPSPRSGLSIPTLDQILISHPSILAAEAKVRSAFQLEKSSKLNLLPSFRLNASATGAGNSLTGRYRVWQHRVGPSLDIPIYDPMRLAQLKVNQSERKLASAKYRSVLQQVLGEIDKANVNADHRKKQLSLAQYEVSSMQRALHHAKSRFDAGVTGKDSFLLAKQELLAAKIRQRKLQRNLLDDRIALIKAMGGN